MLYDRNPYIEEHEMRVSPCTDTCKHSSTGGVAEKGAIDIHGLSKKYLNIFFGELMEKGWGN
jgi:hypothetical protein